MPVSYTHLDVYKRQIVSRVSVPTMASRPAAEVVRDMGGAVEQVLALSLIHI